jgi:hypothetical protein
MPFVVSDGPSWLRILIFLIVRGFKRAQADWHPLRSRKRLPSFLHLLLPPDALGPVAASLLQHRMLAQLFYHPGRPIEVSMLVVRMGIGAAGQVNQVREKLQVVLQRLSGDIGMSVGWGSL